jgi:hypothetical protein
MTLTNHDLVSPFLPARDTGDVTREPSPLPVDESAEGMRRLRDPFAVDPTAAPRETTGDQPSGPRPEREAGRR